MKLSVGLINVLLTSASALTVKRQNDTPYCVEGDPGNLAQGPYQSMSDCLAVCYMTETSGPRVGLLCKGHCSGIPIIGAGASYLCDTNDD
ncbi:hypothetical protein PTNB73_08341 [Pyrenophora teres f. teres]|uniref:Uncharacterized protein n=1 Tax=Pyrenophora teres f. teres TaxID=97479 RepID=A0A6S6W9B6_9PLEO|nr:hypothetical protein PTNB85_05770 [Pyrenophora teres f. teres]KAE8858861.1 hypothetical protein PTNB73_08341 [Pyrenophora teres f. teres]KAE8860724.1 hypothetical protein PTNB29_05819 [Pyrenophora teres f. teres]CAE7195963.1 hypothetical protein PTTW11_08246 [Pyrenophora teres f. teres]